MVASLVGPRDLRAFCALLESRAGLYRIPTPVASNGEIGEIARRVGRRGGPALLFERVDERSTPILANPFGTAERLALGLGVSTLDDISDLVADPLHVLRSPATGGMTDRLRRFGEMSQVSRLAPRIVDRAAVQEVRNLRPSLADLPFIDLDGTGTRSFSLALLMQCDPETGESWATTASGSILDDRRIALTLSHDRATECPKVLPGPTSNGARENAPTKPSIENRRPAVIAIGLDAASLLVHLVRLPAHIDPWALAGSIRRAPIDLARSSTIDIPTPGHAEIILEGYVENTESPGDAGRTASASTRTERIFNLTGLSHRRDPILVASVGDRASADERCLRRALERLLLPLVRDLQPDIVDLSFPIDSDSRGVVLVSIRRRSASAATSVIASILGCVSMMTANVVIVFDEEIDLRDATACALELTRNVDWNRDVSLLNGRSSVGHGGIARIGINATDIGHASGARSDRSINRADRERISAIVDQKWASYGIPL